MTQEVETVKGSATVADAAKLMKFKGIHSLLVEPRNAEDAYGIVTDTDIVNKVVAFGKDPKAVKVYEVMTKPCIVVNPDLAVEYVARLLAQCGIDRAPVIQGELLGIVSLNDILHRSEFIEHPRVPLLQKALQAAVAEARAVSAVNAADTEAYQLAWEEVNEIEAELAFIQGMVPARAAQAEFGEAAAQPVAV
ncbi:CBS domain-containing protein [Leptolyngbya iicbica LK]|uniref:CBS domain-containing protein n=3 Tax=Cyanophyceae TaxID=3028117 RepID=A0A4Q7EF13_9CYAN|nr:CBS domain-containing protein [Leptolyngbya sp. LK]